MRRLAAVLLVAAAALLVGCGSSELEKRVTSLEGQVRNLEQRTAAAEGSITSTSRGLETAAKAGTALESRLASTATKVSVLEKQIESRNSRSLRPSRRMARSHRAVPPKLSLAQARRIPSRLPRTSMCRMYWSMACLREQ
jgi:chromosome segregation ATPase